MFKHEMIPSSALDNKVMNRIADIMRMSIEIHAGKSDAFSSEYMKQSKKFVTDFSFERFAVPFQETLLTYTVDSPETNDNCIVRSSKRAVLVCKTANNVTIYSFAFKDDISTWDLCPTNLTLTYNVGVSEASYNNFVGVDLKLEDEEYFSRILSSDLLFAKIVFDVLSCKNVSLTPVEPPEKLNKKRIKKGKQPLYRYHVLTVDLDKGRKQSGVGRGANLGTMPVHLCRGHFKEYTTEKPLFGRVTGRFWWQPYARGKAENGVVMKDYEIKKSNV